ncbi:6-bladed beta-propeller protein [Belliella buryatensis]|uniref:6-bladed beta-propeller protein n=1 Tax=Belliella buryatensis TaxID=1500549 RepID=A0A239B2M2_9BACT|nr:6-bladed beta-propeller [Belliella buryatensis]SNS01861.1 6-bladed beta-propeller protein [Belliella buryatensis]
MLKVIFYISLLAVFVSCKSETTSNDLNIFKVDFNKEITIKYSELFESFEIVQLRPFTPIGSLDQLIYSEDQIIVVDQTVNKMIHIFSKSGDFIAEINNKGNGPSEFINQRGVRLSKNKKDLYFYCPINKKILIYGLDGVFKKEFYQKDFLSVGDMFVLDDGIVLVDFVQDDKDKKLIFLEDDFVNYHYLKYPKEGAREFEIEGGKSDYFFQGTEEIYYKEMMQNNVFRILKDKSIECISIDIGDKSLKMEKNRTYSFQEIFQEQIFQDAFIMGDGLVDLGDYILMGLWQADKNQMIISNKETQKTVLVQALENDMDGILKWGPFTNFDSPGYFVYPINYHFLNSIFDLENFSNDHYKSELAKVKDGDAEDIVLMIYKLKPKIRIDF